MRRERRDALLREAGSRRKAGVAGPARPSDFFSPDSHEQTEAQAQLPAPPSSLPPPKGGSPGALRPKRQSLPLDHRARLRLSQFACVWSS